MLLIIIFIFAQPNEGCTGKKGFQNGSTLKRVLVSKLKKKFFSASGKNIRRNNKRTGK